MALGVLNNLSAIYAENNLNNTSNSLQTVLQQLSSGSKINSGADDAAGLSLVNGLAANSAALTQSKTNATEGVGLLQVADGALSQVTNLLDRAITLATEASNGTLNSSQDAAANQEYMTIMSEINNIGQTTTYNQQQVFNGRTVSIYTGDSSAAGSSIDNLYIRTLSQSSVGDTGGMMSYSDGTDNVFINLSNTNPNTGVVTNAQATDTLNASGVTSIKINYLVKGANGAETAATTSITVGMGTSYPNTANGLISAINNTGLGLTATFGTQAAAGMTGGGSQTGIEISGGLISVGVDPNTVSTSGILNPAGISGENLTQGQVLTVQVGGVTAAAITIDSSTATLTNLANAINHPNNQQAQNTLVTATVVTNGNGSQSLALTDTATNGGALTASITPPATTGNTMTVGSVVNNIPATLSLGSGSTGQPGSEASVTLGLGSSQSSGTDVLGGTIVLSNQTAGSPASGVTFVMGSGAAVGSSAGSLLGSVFTVNGNTLANLATAIGSAAAGLGVDTSVGSGGITITSSTAGTTLQQIANPSFSLTSTPALNQTSNVVGASPTSGTDGSTTLTMSGNAAVGFQGADTLNANTSIVLTNGTATTPGTAYTFVMGSAAAVSGGNTVFTTGATTVNGLIAAINTSNPLGSHISASLSNGQIVLNSTQVGTTIAAAAPGVNNTLVDTPNALAGTITASLPSAPTASTGATLFMGPQQIGAGVISAGSDALSGNIILNSGLGSIVTFTMGATGPTTGYGTSNVAVGPAVVNGTNSGNTLAELAAAINGDTTNTGISAGVNAAGTGLTFTTASTGGSITIANNISDSATLTAAAATGGANLSDIVALTDGGMIPGTGNGTSGLLSGSIVITNNTGGAGLVTDTFVMGGNSANNTATVFYTGAGAGTTDTLAHLETAIGNVVALHLTATQDPTTGGLSLVGNNDVGLTAISSLTDLLPTITPTQGSNGAGGQTATAASINFADGSTMNANTDPVAGEIVLTNTPTVGSAYGTNHTAVTFAIGTGPANANTYYTGNGHTSLSDLATLINTENTALNLHLNAVASSTGLRVTSSDTTSTITEGTDTLVDTANAIQGTGGVPTLSPAGTSTGASFAMGVSEINSNPINTASDSLNGSIVLSNGTSSYTFGMAGSGIPAGPNDYAVPGNSLLALATAINLQKGTTNISAAINSSGTGLDFSATPAGVSAGIFIGVDTANLSDQSTLSFTSPASGSNNTNQNLSGVIALTDTGKITANGTVSGTVTVTNGTGASAVTDTFVMGAGVASSTYSVGGGTFNIASNSLTDLMTAINQEGGDSSNGNKADLYLNASIDQATGGIFLQSTQAGATGLSANTSLLKETLGETSHNGTDGLPGATSNNAAVNYTNGGTNLPSDPVIGSIVLANVQQSGGTYGLGGGAVTFHVGGSASLDTNTDIYTGSSAANETMQGLANAINHANASVASGGLGLGLSLSAIANGSGLTVTSSDSTSTIAIGASTLTDLFGVVQGNQLPGDAVSSATYAAATVGTSGIINSTDQLSGSIILSNGTPGVPQAFIMGPAPSSNPIAGAIYTVGYTINDLATAITQSGINLRASVANGALNLQATNTATTITVGNGTPAGNTLTDKMAEQITSPNTGIYSSPSTVTMTLGSGTLSGDDVLTKGSSIAISANGSGPFTFVVGGTTLGSTIGVTSGDKLSDLLTAIDTKLNVNGLFSGNSLTLTSNVANNTPIVVSGISLNDAGVGATTSVSSLGSFSSLNDAVSGKITFNLQGTPNASQTITIGGGSTVQSMIDQINGVTGSNPLGNDPYGVHAKATLTNDGFESITLTSDTYGVAGEIQNTGGTSIIDQTATAALSYTPFNPYSTGVSNYSLYDSSSGQTSAAQAAFVANSTGASGVATISYSDGAGQSLSGTDLLSQHDAQDALNKLNLAISDVAAMDGYIGAQINTLNSVSQVLSTQQENVVSAQNAIQATDYASATSNMSKYEILSQTGISALAQANSEQRDVTKLLQ